MNSLTIAELRLRQAQLAERAERLRQDWRTLPVGGRSLTMGKRVELIQQQADDYASLLRIAESEGAMP